MLTPIKSGRYISILADGRLHETVLQNTEGAVLREYETSDGKKGSKWERVFGAIKARITGIKFQDGDYGESIQITFDDGENKVILSQLCASSFGEDILKKLPAIDFSKEVSLRPYAFEGEDEKMVRGVEVKQNGEKVTNYFWDAEKKEPLNGFPAFDGNKSDKDDWKIHFLKARKFLVNYAKENIVPKFSSVVEYPELDGEPPF